MRDRTPTLLSSVAPLGALALALVFCIATPVRAGGPLDLVNHQPVVYANGGSNLKLNVDRGPLGSRTNAQAVGLVQNAIGLWNTVPTSTMRLSLGAALSTDYTRWNYSGIFNNFTDGFNPVIFDSDGSITDAIFGTGAKSSILGFAGSAYYVRLAGGEVRRGARGAERLHQRLRRFMDARPRARVRPFLRPRSFADRQRPGDGAEQLRRHVSDRVPHLAPGHQMTARNVSL